MTDNLRLTERTLTISYEELEAAIVSYLQTVHILNPNEEYVIELDLDVPLNDSGLVEFDVVTAPFDQMEFEFEPQDFQYNV